MIMQEVYTEFSSSKLQPVQAVCIIYYFVYCLNGGLSFAIALCIV